MLLRIFIGCLAVSLIAGCGGEDKPREYTVKGTVNYAGKPLESGSIVLDPVDGNGAAASGGIENGTFELKSQPGQKKVRITAVRQTGEKDQYEEIISEAYVPKKYNDETTLEFEVKPNDENKAEWNLDK